MDTSTENQLRHEGIQDTDAEHINWVEVCIAAQDELDALENEYL